MKTSFILLTEKYVARMVHSLSIYMMREVSEGDERIVDSGDPKRLVVTEWLEKYLKKNNLVRNELKSKNCDQNFRFGPGPVYKSEEKVVILGTVRTED